MMMRINLLPVRQQVKRQAGRQVLVLFGVSLLGAVVLNFLWYQDRDGKASRMAGKNAETSKRIQELEKVIGEVNNINKKKKEVDDKLKVLENLRRQRSGPVRLLDALANAVPRYVDLVDFSEANGAVRITGKARSHEDVAELMRGLANVSWTSKGLGRIVERKRDSNTVRVELLAFGGEMEDFPAAEVGVFFKNIELKQATQSGNQGPNVSSASRAVSFDILMNADYAT